MLLIGNRFLKLTDGVPLFVNSFGKHLFQLAEFLGLFGFCFEISQILLNPFDAAGSDVLRLCTDPITDVPTWTLVFHVEYSISCTILDWDFQVEYLYLDAQAYLMKSIGPGMWRFVDFERHLITMTDEGTVTASGRFDLHDNDGGPQRGDVYCLQVGTYAEKVFFDETYFDIVDIYGDLNRSTYDSSASMLVALASVKG